MTHTAAQLLQDLNYSILIHDTLPKKPANAFRKFGGNIPYGAHPAWCGLTVLFEHTLSPEIRTLVAKALFLHDVIEDTNADLPRDTPPELALLVEELTFRPGVEKDAIFDRSELAQLAKLYDCTNNLLGLRPADQGAKLSAHIARTLKLSRRAEARFGTLDIVTLARALCAAKNPRKETV